MASVHCRLAAFVGVAVLIASCSSAPLPRADCPANSTPEPGDLGCEEAVGAAVAALPADHAPVARIQFVSGAYCPPGSYCALISRSYGTVMFTFRPRFGSPTTDAFIEVVREVDGQVRTVSRLTAVDAQGIPSFPRRRPRSAR